MRIKANAVLEREIEHLLTRPVGRPSRRHWWPERMRSVTKQREGLGELEESTCVSRLKRLSLVLQGLGHWKRPKSLIVAKKFPWALDAEGGAKLR